MSSSRQLKVPQSSAELTGFDACKQSLLSVIESQIVPQLVLAHADPSAYNKNTVSYGRVDRALGETKLHAQAEVAFAPSAAATVEFAHLCCLDDEQPCQDYVARLMVRHNSTPSLLLNLITPAARYLGELWTQDRLDFSHVTIGLIRMQNMTHHYGFLNCRALLTAGDKRRVLVAAAPGSQHLLGLAMVSEFFVQAGWDVTVEVATTAQELFNAVHKNWFELVGLSVGLVEQLEALPQLVAQLRQAAVNPHMAIMAGGAAFTTPGTTAPDYGCDSVCTDPLQAMDIAAKLAKQQKSA